MYRRARLGLLLCVLCSLPLSAQSTPSPLQALRDAHPCEFIDSVGQKAAIFGNEAGSLEGWVYPLKFFKNFHLVFHADQRILPADSLARTVITRPESTTIVYATDTFSVRETICAPVREAGALILLDVDSFAPLEIEAQFEPDVQLAWPASIGGTYFHYHDDTHRFEVGADGRKLFGVFGSPTASIRSLPYDTNYSSSNLVSMAVGAPVKGHQQFVVAWALSTESQQAALDTYSQLLANPQQFMGDSAKYYADYLANTVNISVPDAQLQSAYDWSRVSIVQGMVNSPGDGYGLIAGYRTSFGYRAGFDWFFGRDSLWTSLALLKEGDFSNVKAVLTFLAKFQRDDGKIAHEIAHLATETDWFRTYPYSYAAADATPLYLIVAREYVRTTGDQAWVKDNWDHLARAYKFLLSTRENGVWPKNRGVGHGWIEGGPLLPIETEFYQAGLSVEAIIAMTELARIAGQSDLAQQAQQEADTLHKRLDVDFWSDKTGTLALGIDASGKVLDRSTILVAAPLWWPLVSDEKAQKTIDVLASPEIAADWGSRIISNKGSLFDPSGYHFGSVWPLFTGWASVADYQFHRPLEGYAQLRDNALLTHSGAPGHVTEVLSGTYFEPLPASTPHQIWSSAMVVSPILRGMFGVDTRADGTLTLAPHFPATWRAASIDNLRAGAANISVAYKRNGAELSFNMQNRGTAAATVTLSPAIALSATVVLSTIDGKAEKAETHSSSQDQHATLHFSIATGSTRTIMLRVRNDFGLEYASQLPASGSESEGLRFVKEQWSASTASFVVSGVSGHTYLVKTGGDAQIASVDNAENIEEHGERLLKISFPSGADHVYQTKTVTVHLGKR